MICIFEPAYFQALTGGIPDICEYTIYMSYKANAANSGGTGIAGLNICANGVPKNYYLDSITPNMLFILRNASNNFNYLSIVSTASASVKVIIEDLLS